MLRAGALRLLLSLLACFALTALCGCGGGDKPSSSALTFERLSDTTGLSHGAAVLLDFDAYRMPGGSLRVKAHLRLPEGTRVRVALRPAGNDAVVAMADVPVLDGLIETPPLMAETGPLPVARYRFELTAQFAPAMQPPQVMRDTDDGKSLRGPGVTRGRHGEAAFTHVEEMTR